MTLPDPSRDEPSAPASPLFAPAGRFGEGPQRHRRLREYVAAQLYAAAPGIEDSLDLAELVLVALGEADGWKAAAAMSAEVSELVSLAWHLAHGWWINGDGEWMTKAFDTDLGIWTYLSGGAASEQEKRRMEELLSWPTLEPSDTDLPS